MISAKAFLNHSISFEKICDIYSPKIKEVVENDMFNTYRSILTTTYEDLEDTAIEAELKENPLSKLENLQVVQPFDYLLAITYNDPVIAKVVKDAFKFFIHEDVHFVLESKLILIGDINDLLKMEDLSKARQLNENNFFSFQNSLRQVLGENEVKPPEVTMHPKLRKMKYTARYRDKIKSKKNSVQLGTLLSSICCMGIGITPLNIGEISYAAFNAILSIYGQKELYEQQIQTLLAGGDSDKIKPHYWISDPKNDE